MITDDVKKYIDQSVLCWLATSNAQNEPNVSPKEMFTYKDDATLLIANLASPNSVKNIIENPNVSVSFVEIFVQKGYKLKGKARIIEKSDKDFNSVVKPLIDLFSDIYPIQSVIEINIESVDPILAPSYFLFKGTTEQSQISNGLKTYKVKKLE